MMREKNTINKYCGKQSEIIYIYQHFLKRFMKIQQLSFILLLGIISCQTKKKSNNENQNPLGSWLITNEDSLKKEFGNLIRRENIKKEIGSNTISKGWFIDDSTLLGTLTRKINNLDSNLLISYEYHPRNNKKFAIKITSDRKKSTIKVIDSLFNDIDSLKYLEIIKYNPPNVEMSKYINEDELGKQIIIDPEQVNFKLTNEKSKIILSCFIKKEIPISMKQDLIYDILGEEIILKQVENIQFFDERKNDTSLISIKNLRRYFKIYN
jgi:hypothetical protein